MKCFQISTFCQQTTNCFFLRTPSSLPFPWLLEMELLQTSSKYHLCDEVVDLEITKNAHSQYKAF